MVKLKTKLGPKGQMVIPKILREKLGIKSGSTLLIDEEGGKIIIEKLDVDEFIQWIRKTRKKIAEKPSDYSLEDEFE